jgi:hypothetical protein
MRSVFSVLPVLQPHQQTAHAHTYSTACAVRAVLLPSITGGRHRACGRRLLRPRPLISQAMWLLAYAGAAVAAAAGGRGAPDQPENIVATWKGYVWGMPNGVLPSGPLIGNGDLGMTLQTGNRTGCIEFWLGLNSMWGIPPSPENPTNNTLGSGGTFKPYAPWPHQQPLGGITLCARDPAFLNATFAATQRFADGIIQTTYTAAHNMTLTTRSFMHPREKVLVTEVAFERAAAEQRLEQEGWPPEVTVESWTSTLWYNATAAAAAASTRGGTLAAAAAQYFTRVAIPANTAAHKRRQLHVAVVTQICAGSMDTRVLSRSTRHNDTASAAAGLPRGSVGIGAQTVLRSSRFTLVTLSKSNLVTAGLPDANSSLLVWPLGPGASACYVTESATAWVVRRTSAQTTQSIRCSLR